jgi:hypothetical protein
MFPGQSGMRSLHHPLWCKPHSVQMSMQHTSNYFAAIYLMQIYLHDVCAQTCESTTPKAVRH